MLIDAVLIRELLRILRKDGRRSVDRDTAKYGRKSQGDDAIETSDLTAAGQSRCGMRRLDRLHEIGWTTLSSESGGTLRIDLTNK